MKKLSYVYLFIILFATSCGRDGEPGPQGIPGPQGPPGFDGEEAYVFDGEFDFNSANDYTVRFEFEALPHDVVLVYLLWDYDEEVGEIWRLLPQSQMMEFGWLQYNYDYSQYDVSIFMEANFPLGNLGPNYTDDWVARVVIVPGQELGNARTQNTVDFTDYNAVKEAYGIPDLPLPEGYQPINR